MIANGLPSILWWASDYQRKLKGQFRKRAICQKHSWQWIHARTRLFKVTVTVPIVLSKGCCQRQYWLSWRGSKCWWGFPSVFSHQGCWPSLLILSPLALHWQYHSHLQMQHYWCTIQEAFPICWLNNWVNTTYTPLSKNTLSARIG